MADHIRNVTTVVIGAAPAGETAVVHGHSESPVDNEIHAALMRDPTRRCAKSDWRAPCRPLAELL
jgi:hypothetical protein